MLRSGSWILTVFLLLTSGCHAVPGIRLVGNGSPGAEQRRLAEAQTQLMNAADNYMMAAAELFEGVASRALTREARQSASASKVLIATACVINATNNNVLAGWIDQCVMSRLAVQVCAEPFTAERFGEEEAARMLAVLKREDEETWRIAARFLADAQLQELDQVIREWRSENLERRNVVNLRLIDLPQASQAAASRGPSSIFALLYLDPLANIDPAVREIEQSRNVAERMFFFFQRLPMLITWQSERIYQRALGQPEIAQAFNNADDLTQTIMKFSATSEEFAQTIEKFRSELTQHRQEAIQQLASAVEQERKAAIEQLQHAVESQRQASITQAGEELTHLIEQAGEQTARVVAKQREGLEGNLKSVMRDFTTIFYYRALSLLVIAAMVFLLTAILYRIIVVRWLPKTG